ncbi:MAG: choice-of-anchor D domain-containing protein, partial [Myxococcota bacterium]
MKMRAALPLVLLPSFLTACDGSAPGLAGLEVGATALVFEDVEPGSEVEKSAALRNVGERRIVIDRAAVAPAGLEAFFPVLRGPEGREQQPLILGPGEEGSVAVTFRPRVLGPLEATLRLNVSDASDVEIALSGSTRLNPCGLRVEPDSVIFDNVLVGSTKTLALSVTNECEGRAEVLIGTDANVRLCEETEGANLANFCLTSRRAVVVGEDRRFELEGGATADFQVRFSPVVGGTRSRGQLTFQTCGSPICRIPVDLQGFGVESGLRCRPPTLDFGRVIPGGSSSESVVCENIANEQATIVSWDLSQDSHPAFEAERSRPQVLEAGDSASIEVTFSPLALSEVEGTLQIVTDHPNPALRNLSVALTGTGGGANLQVLPTSGLNFGEVALIAPGRRSFAITNTGFAPVTLLEIQVDTLGTQAFSSPNANPNVLSPGESLLVTIEFGPRAVGAVQSFIRVVSDSARQGVVEIPVRGVGVSLPPCQFNLSPDLIDFGDVVRSRSSRQGLRVLNEGNTDCLITGIRLMAGSDPAFRLAAPESPSQRLSPGEAKVIFLDFAPHAAGRVSGRIEVSISTPSSPHNVVELAGTGVDDGPLIAPSVLDFGARETSCGARRELRIHNTGAVPLVLDRIGLAAGSDAAGFSLSN